MDEIRFLPWSIFQNEKKNDINLIQKQFEKPNDSQIGNSHTYTAAYTNNNKRSKELKRA